MQHVLIIAEAGVNHNGDPEMARRLVDAAAEAGADYVKFQTFVADQLVSPEAKKASYQSKNTNDATESQLSMLKKLELDEAAHVMLKKYCEEKKIHFLSTAFDPQSILLLDRVGIDLVKIPSGEITNLAFLKAMGSKGMKVLLSTGMSNMKDIDDALSVLENAGTERKNITVLHCNTEYPTPMEDVNLKAMLSISDKFGVAIGYSDHTLGIEIPIAAVAMGATVIEKHLTLNRELPGPDHKASLEPAEFKAMVKAIRNIEKAMGDGVKQPSASEQKNISIARKSLHARKSLPMNHLITEDDFVAKRPGDGISPMELPSLIGKKILRNILEGQIIKAEDIQK
ncbi:N-acetylneuraminate synthase [soil metagenome]